VQQLLEMDEDIDAFVGKGQGDHELGLRRKGRLILWGQQKAESCILQEACMNLGYVCKICLVVEGRSENRAANGDNEVRHFKPQRQDQADTIH
jgi:hypothetical protein